MPGGLVIRGTYITSVSDACPDRSTFNFNVIDVTLNAIRFDQNDAVMCSRGYESVEDARSCCHASMNEQTILVISGICRFFRRKHGRAVTQHRVPFVGTCISILQPFALTLHPFLQMMQQLTKTLSSGFLFGYEDELACITDPLGPILGVGDDDEDDDDSWGDDWDDEEGWRRRRRKREIPSYR